MFYIIIGAWFTVILLIDITSEKFGFVPPFAHYNERFMYYLTDGHKTTKVGTENYADKKMFPENRGLECLREHQKRKRMITKIIIGFYLKSRKKIFFNVGKIKAFYIKYKIILIILSSIVAAAAFGYALYSIHGSITAYNATNTFLACEEHKEMFSRFLMYKQDFANFIRQHMPKTYFRQWLHRLNNKYIAEGKTPFITQNIAKLFHYNISEAILSIFREKHINEINDGKYVIAFEIEDLDPLSYFPTGNETMTALESAENFNQEFTEVKNVFNSQQDIIKNGTKIVSCCFLIIVVCGVHILLLGG